MNDILRKAWGRRSDIDRNGLQTTRSRLSLPAGFGEAGKSGGEWRESLPEKYWYCFFLCLLFALDLKTGYNCPMDSRRPKTGKTRKILSRAKNFLLVALFILVPFAGAFHPKIRRREDPNEKEIGTEVP
jgi:hypothetical protein